MHFSSVMKQTFKMCLHIPTQWPVSCPGWSVLFYWAAASHGWASGGVSRLQAPSTFHWLTTCMMPLRGSLHQKPKWQSVFRFPLCTGRSCKLYLSHPGPQATTSVLMIIRFELTPTVLQVCKALFQLSCHQLSPLTVDPGLVHAALVFLTCHHL